MINLFACVFCGTIAVVVFFRGDSRYKYIYPPILIVLGILNGLCYLAQH
jgi:hypothetical protein